MFYDLLAGCVLHSTLRPGSVFESSTLAWRVGLGFRSKRRFRIIDRTA